MSTSLVIILSIIFIAIVIVQIGKLSELVAKVRGEEESRIASNNRTAVFLVVFMVLFLAGCIFSAIYYTDVMLGYGPHQSASEHGGKLDSTFKITLFFTGIVFVITQIFLFYFAWKYREKKGQKAVFMPHDNRLEIVWTVIPAITMTFLVVNGLVTWNEVMADVNPSDVPGKDYIEIEGVGNQFAWTIRYPGEDNLLGTRNYQLIDLANNPLGQDWDDTKNLDDLHVDEIVLPVGQKVRVRITSKDVLHNFYLPHFRVKMDAVPGLPTYFVFTPKTTTEEYRERLGKRDKDGNPMYPEWHVPADPENPDGKRRWETFNFELACAELCGKGHYSMRRLVRIVEEDEYKAWLKEQTPYYEQTVKGTDADPYKTEEAVTTTEEEGEASEEEAATDTAEGDNEEDAEQE